MDRDRDVDCQWCDGVGDTCLGKWLICCVLPSTQLSVIELAHTETLTIVPDDAITRKGASTLSAGVATPVNVHETAITPQSTWYRIGSSVDGAR